MFSRILIDHVPLSSHIANVRERDKQVQTTGQNSNQPSRNELLELHRIVLERVRKMTPQEGFQSLVASGIYSPDGKLAKEYGG